jgi:LysM repeat protein
MRVRVLFLAAAASSLVAPAAASANVAHTIASGESLWSVAAADGLTVNELAAANGLSSDSQLTAGATLEIPAQPGGVPASSPAGGGSSVASSSTSGGGGSPAAASPSGGGYVVAPGDTLSAIAERAGMSVSQLAADNGLNPNGILLSGKVLTLSGGSGSSASNAGTESSVGASQAASSQPVGRSAEGSSSGPPYPTGESVAPSEVGQIASANGVSPSLAEAIAYQESGFNNGVTSSADARGIMQILPGTWNWISQNLAGSTPLNPASAGSNIRAGVLLLHSLLNSTGGDPALAAAGYYQGLPSVRAHGMYGSTQQYVADVMALRQRFSGG